MITTSPSRDVQQRREDTLCKFIREYIYKVAQVVVAARRGSHKQHNESLSGSWSDLHASHSQWFRVESSDSQRVQKYVEEECIANWDPAHHSNFELTIDISLSAEPLSEHVLLERWKIKFSNKNMNASHELSPSLLYKQMTIQIRSILSYLRLLPSHCIVQSWEQSMAQQSQLIKSTKMMDMIPFALYHLIYSHHNKQNDNISNFTGNSKSFSFEPLMCKFGKITTTVFYGANIRAEFEWLIRSVPAPGCNAPLINDNLSQHIDQKYCEKKKAHIVNKPSPPIKSLNNMTNFHESPLLDPSTPKVDPMKEMEKIRLSTIFGAAPPVISLADCVNINNVQISNDSLVSSNNTLNMKSDDMNCDDSRSDHDDMQDEIFQGYQHHVDAYDDNNVNQKYIAQISHFINMCENASKLKLESFEKKDALLNDENGNQVMDDSKKYFELLSEQFQRRQKRLIQLKKSSTAILSMNQMNQI